MSVIVGIDSSSVSAGCAVVIDGKTVADGFIHNGLTHSQTLLPLISDTMAKADVKCGDVDFFCVTTGPGSFTGLRIGLSTVKGLAAPYGTKCVGISSLEAAAFGIYKNENYQNFEGFDEGYIICAAMDARCKQVYNALFSVDENGCFSRICKDRALSVDELFDELCEYDKKIVVCGDGTSLCSECFGQNRNIIYASGDDMFISGAAVAALCEKYRENAMDFSKLFLEYLRLSQAQRELKLKKSKESEKS